MSRAERVTAVVEASPRPLPVAPGTRGAQVAPPTTQAPTPGPTLVPVPRPARRRLRVPVGTPALLGDVVVASAVLPAMHGGRPAAVVAALTVAVVGATVGGYRRRLHLSTLDDLPGLVAAALAATVAATAVSEVPPLGTALCLVALLVCVRAAVHTAARAARTRGRGVVRTLVVDTGRSGRRVAATAIDRPEYGLEPIGLVGRPVPSSVDDLPVRVVGRVEDLADLVVRRRAEVVVVAPDADDDVVATALRACDRLDCDIYLVPRLPDLHHRGRDMDELWGIPLVRMRRSAWRTRTWRLKRVLDVVVAATALVLTAPVLLAAALALRPEVGRSVLYRQVRVGLDGRPFTIYKLRTMPTAPGTDVGAATWSIAGDPRVGPVGAFLRATSIDELPQLVNILRGDMSLVGPRPERPAFADRFAREVPGYRHRHRIPVGLTGWAQVNGLRGDTSIEDRARFDNYYIQNWSLWLDLRILARTAWSVLARRGG